MTPDKRNSTLPGCALYNGSEKNHSLPGVPGTVRSLFYARSNKASAWTRIRSDWHNFAGSGPRSESVSIKKTINFSAKFQYTVLSKVLKNMTPMTLTRKMKQCKPV
jgi:hypothetical protein